MQNASSRRRRWPVATILLLAAVGVGVAFYLTKRSASTTAPRATALVTRGNVELTVLATGTLKPTRLVAVGAQVSGRVTSVKAIAGQRVSKGDLVAEIDSITQENALRTARASLAGVRAQKAEREASLALAERTYARQKSMYLQKAVSQADFESAEATVATTKAQIASLDSQIVASEIAVGTAEANLGYTKITAPIDGTVLSVVSQEGQTVNANQSAPTILILGTLESMTVRAQISEADVAKVQPGQPLYFTVVGEPEHRYEATLLSIEPAPESIRSDSSFSASGSSSSSSSAVYYIGVFDVPNKDLSLRTYMTAEVHIVLGAAKNVLTVAAAALGRKRKDGRHVVRVVGADNQVTEKLVEVGLNNKVVAEVKSGLTEGERVVVADAPAPSEPPAQARQPRMRGMRF
jgi:macrolide-specific efflux system membrane fusion protein